MPYLMQQKAADKLGIALELVGVASTGVIGEIMRMEPIVNGIQKLKPEVKIGKFRFIFTGNLDNGYCNEKYSL